jgi:trk system potassium uptake protein TrkA
MKIIILGAGQVGRSVAESLASEANDITVVDTQSRLLKDLQEHLDIRTVQGHGAHPSVLIEAGIEDADLILAVTNSDETNMVACQIAANLFHTPTKLARVRSNDYLRHAGVFSAKAIPVDFIISPEELVTTFIQHLIDQPGVLQILDFVGGKAQLVAVRAYYGGPLVGQSLSSLVERIPGVDTRIVAIFRRDRAIIPDGTTVVEADDEVFFLAAREQIPRVVGAFRRSEKPYRRVIISGGGNIGKRLAASIEDRYHTKIIEIDALRCRYLARTLEQTVVLQGDAADADLLREEDIADTDVYCAVTNDDEANILSAMLAKRLGARKTLCLINRPSYVDLAQGTAVDIAVSPAQATIGSLLTHIRKGDVVSVHALRRGAAEAIEIVVHGDRHSSRVVGRRLSELELPEGSNIGAIAREGQILFPGKGCVLQAGDHVILFLADKRQVSSIERLFQVSFNFI